MANCCDANISLSREETNPFTQDEIEQIGEALAAIDHCGSGAFDFESTDLLEWHGDTRWSLPEEKLVAIATTFKCRVRALGREDMMGLIEVICIESDGTVKQSEGITYAF